MSGEEVKVSRMEKLRQAVKELPVTPGVYLMKNKVEKIIYVGKAKNLRSRVRSYFGSEKNLTRKTVLLVGNVHSFDYILTGTEVEAFLLEASLIKKHRPRYNVRLKDDKNYPYIRMSSADGYPRLYLQRKVKQDGSTYFGPYTNSWSVRETIKFLNKTYQIRDCRDAFFKSRKRPCMTHQIGRCSAPCVDLVSQKEYLKDIQGAIEFLQGADQKVIQGLTAKMMKLAKSERFESAAKIRDNIAAIKSVFEKQSVINANSHQDQDVIGYHGDERGTLVESLHVRKGRVIGNQSHFIPLLNVNSEGEDVREWLVSFVNQYYLENFVPDELILSVDIGNDLRELLSQVLQQRSGHPVQIRFATDVEGRELLDMVAKNAASHFQRHVSKSEAKMLGLESIKSKLKLGSLPRRIECYDISTFQGKETVASQVVFEDGVPSKDDYRRYRIKTVEGTDDFASMKEVLARRFKHTEWELPDLVVIDGGKGQLGMALEALKELDVEGVPLVGLAKARTERDFQKEDVQATEERFYLPGRQNPVVFSSNSEAYRILVGIRDEAHRFAINYHRKLRENSSLQSELDEVSGLGEKRKKALLTFFESVAKIRQASVNEIASLPGFNKTVAESILAQLSGNDLSED